MKKSPRSLRSPTRDDCFHHQYITSPTRFNVLFSTVLTDADSLRRHSRHQWYPEALSGSRMKSLLSMSMLRISVVSSGEKNRKIFLPPLFTDDFDISQNRFMKNASPQWNTRGSRKSKWCSTLKRRFHEVISLI